MNKRPSRDIKAGIILLTVVLMLAGGVQASYGQTPGGEQKAAIEGVAPGPKYFVDEHKLPFDPLPGAEVYWGVHNGAGYRIEVPASWNGDLVMWAHGFRGPVLELTVDNPPLREALVANGYAWAASSFSKNDFNVTAGVQDTHALAKLFNGLVGKPDRTYITGASIGGHVAAVSVEQWKEAYDGALAACGTVGDFENFDFYLDFNLAAQQLGTDSSQFPVDGAEYLGVTVPTIKANLEAVPDGWPIILTTNGRHFKNLVELRSGGDRPNFDEAWYFWNTFPVFSSAPGNYLFDIGTGDGTLPGLKGMALDNSEVVYQFDTDPVLSPEEQALNDNIFRVKADTNTRKSKGIRNIPPVTGKINAPVLTLHNLGDLFVPFHNEIEYATNAAAQGRSDLLVQRAIRGVGHCDFTDAELARAFLDLVTWVEAGLKPTGDNVVDPATVAAPDFGCAFTAGSHLLAAPCP